MRGSTTAGTNWRLQRLAADELVQVTVSITTLDGNLAGRLEPRASSPKRRLELIRNLASAGIPTGIFMAPLIPFLNDQEISKLLGQARAAGALEAIYILLRLPREVEGLFRDWLAAHLPELECKRFRRPAKGFGQLELFEP